ncbi:hypothetical protein [Roseibium marinum]|uniref:Uncharacterized protein n=1 Tax=Roseibium marinum TaxID=281252 RepID=A0A2S3UNI7_9HYPH|nr:hypothetical protein [Roseibium marinum]POF29123.1 hypothetical protein CLV41_110127 [Roseibium marinum]
MTGIVAARSAGMVHGLMSSVTGPGTGTGVPEELTLVAAEWPSN